MDINRIAKEYCDQPQVPFGFRSVLCIALEYLLHGSLRPLHTWKGVLLFSYLLRRENIKTDTNGEAGLTASSKRSMRINEETLIGDEWAWPFDIIINWLIDQIEISYLRSNYVTQIQNTFTFFVRLYRFQSLKYYVKIKITFS